MENRKRLKPWLKRKVEAGEFGLKWINREMQIFSIPWQHKSNKSWKSTNCQIFKEWAKVTGKYQEGQAEDWPIWKTRIRTALTKLNDFVEMPNLHDLAASNPNPCKAYRFVDNVDCKEIMGSSSSTSDSPLNDQSKPSPCFDALASPIAEDMQCENPLPVYNFHTFSANNIQVVEAEASYDNSAIDFNKTLPINTPQIPTFVENTNDGREESMEGSLPSDLKSLDSGTLFSHLKHRPFLKYGIFYSSKMVQEGFLYNDGGLFHTGNIPNSADNFETIYGPKFFSKIRLPPITDLSQSLNEQQQKDPQMIKQQTDLQQIMLNMDRGFILRCKDDVVYARRLCRTRVFATNSVIGSVSLDRRSTEDTKLFDLKDFRQRGAQKPVTTVLTFAKKLQLDSFNKLPMYMMISPCDEEENGLRSGLNSGLEFSDVNSGDQLHNLLSQLSLENNVY